MDWGTLMVIIGLVIAGIGEGTMLTLLFNVLVSASPKEFAGDVGALRGVVNNVSSALGAAFAGVVAVSLLTVALSSSLNRSSLPPQFNLDNFDRVDFVTNAQLESVLATRPPRRRRSPKWCASTKSRAIAHSRRRSCSWL